ncbi:2-hydroxychromene-2-carboxylate isomerase [Paraburkholderia acidisoli]|uniref:2-hydroxychromene-2-carboxylate isomerase n=1 Tax=Paraburkholderia acidisoli TaxID=2571748 RepID=A0A7Z2GKA7_9BURK|nr:2-hydroxychromene-2-carboxylate isomerase [Paraburkholderia acidisoli]QGZ63346.1 2-hydroxychromene-2-carboxylate isomerase [Paraburkholderia acidisoli]
MTTSHDIDFYFDFISPFGYFASLRIDALAARYERRVRWRPVLIGVTVMKIMGSRALIDIPLKGDYIVREAERHRRRHGLTLARGLRETPMNPLPAMRAFAWLGEAWPEHAAPFARACFDAYWRLGRDLSVPEEIALAARSAGLPETVLAALPAACTDGAPLRRQVDEAVSRGVFGSPYFLVDDEPFFGVTSMETLEAWLAAGGW